MENTIVLVLTENCHENMKLDQNAKFLLFALHSRKLSCHRLVFNLIVYHVHYCGLKIFIFEIKVLLASNMLDITVSFHCSMSVLLLIYSLKGEHSHLTKFAKINRKLKNHEIFKNTYYCLT